MQRLRSLVSPCATARSPCRWPCWTGGLRTVARRPSRSRAPRPPQVWDLVAGRLLHDFGARRAAAACLAFHPRARLLAAAAADGTVALLGLEPAGPVATLGPDPAGARRPPCIDPAAPLRPCHGRLHGPGRRAAASGATRGGERGRRGAQARPRSRLRRAATRCSRRARARCAHGAGSRGAARAARRPPGRRPPRWPPAAGGCWPRPCRGRCSACGARMRTWCGPRRPPASVSGLRGALG